MSKAYMPRIYDDILSWRLNTKGAVLIEGPKWCGKTSTAKQQAKSVLYLQDETTFLQNEQLAQIDPQALLTGETPRLIDEWQLIPSLWDSVRTQVDARGTSGQFILTGSATPVGFTKRRHSGVGRFSKIVMRPMSLIESQESSGLASLKALFDKELNGAVKAKEVPLERIAFYTCRGGWPLSIGLDDNIALQQAIDYVSLLCESDICRLDGISRNPELARRVLRSFARHVATPAQKSTIYRDVAPTGELPSRQTVLSYLEALEELFVIENAPAWSPNLRSKTSIRTTSTRYFVDPSIGCAALGVTPATLLQDLNTFGFYFENLCMRDLRVYMDALDGFVYHYRDKSDLECDAVLQLRDGRYGLVEIKLGGEKLIADATSSLMKLEKKLDHTSMGVPAFKMVLTAVGSHAYTQKNGVWVVPITSLGK